MRPKVCLPILARELERRRAAADEVAQLLEVEARVRRRDECPARTQHARDLRQAAIEVRHVVEHPRRDDDVEGRVRERKRLHVRDARIDPTFRRELDHPRREVDRDDLRPGLARDPLGELAPAAAHLEDAPRSGCDDRGDQRDPCVVACAGACVTGGAATEARLVGVLGRDERGIVEAAHGRTIGVPGHSTRRGLAAEPRVDRRTDVRELAVLVDPPRRVRGPRRTRAAARARGCGPSTASSGRSRGRRSGSAGRSAAARRAGRAGGGRSPAGSGGSSPGRCGDPRASPSRRGS